MLAWRFILLWLTVILTVSPPRCTVSVSILVCFSSVSHYACLFLSHSSLSFGLYVSICFCLSFNPSLFHLSSCIALLFIYFSHLFSFTSLLSAYLPPSVLSHLLTVSYISSLPPLSLLPTLRWRCVNMSSTCRLIVPSQQSKPTTLKSLNRFHHMTSCLPPPPLQVEMLNNHEAMPGRQD